MECLSISDTLKKDGSDFKNWQNTADTKIIRHACPECGSDLLCSYADMGTTEFIDTYNHICMNPECHNVQKRDIFGISMGSRDTEGPCVCPFCYRKL